jgi:hypothetical protein
MLTDIFLHNQLDPETEAARIVTLCQVLVAWLHLYTGLSRARTNQVLRALGLILNSVIQLTEFLFRAAGFHSVDLPHLAIPRDIRSVYRGGTLNPDFIRTVCCPKCFSLYPVTSNRQIPEHCTWKESRRTRACGAPLFKKRRTRKGINLTKDIPCRLYTTQSLESWLRYFLGRPGIEDHINRSYLHPPNSNMRGFWDSPAARELGDFRFIQGNLTFALYVDWFNPLTNKISGLL